MNKLNLVPIMQKTLELTLKEHPESESLIKIFSPILLCEEELLYEHALKKAPSRQKQTDKNTPLLDIANIPICSKKAGIFSKKLLHTMEEALPELASEIKLVKDCLNATTAHRLCKEFLAKKEERQEIITTYIDKSLLAPAKKNINIQNDTSTKIAKKTKVRLDDMEKTKDELFFVMELLLTRLTHIFISRAMRATPRVTNNINQNHCPYCGNKPSMSIINEKEGVRELLCSTCDSTWRFKRTACPNCLMDEAKNLHIIYQEKNTIERAIHCESCNHYLLEIDIREKDIPTECVTALSLGMTYLDAIMYEKDAIPFNE